VRSIERDEDHVRSLSRRRRDGAGTTRGAILFDQRKLMDATIPNVNGDSGVTAYEIGDDWIRVRFSTGAVYLYTAASAGTANIERMKVLAARGDGLNAFINTTVRQAYARKER
jgi:hypothetical protein